VEISFVVALFVIVALILLQPAFALPPNPSAINLNYVPADLSWTPMAIAALLVGFAFAALAFMAGEFLSMPSIKAWVKGELYEHSLSAFIILIAIASVITLNWIAIGFVSQPNAQTYCNENLTHPEFDDPNQYPVFTQAQFFLGCKPDPTDFIPMAGNFRGVMLAPMLSAYRHLIGIELVLGILSTMGFSTQQVTAIVTIPRLSFQPLIGMTIVSEAHIIVLDYIALGAGVIFSQKVLLQFIQESMLTIFLPFGLLFRAIPLTRKTGSTIIALCIAAYFVYPMSILINSQIFQNLTPINFAEYQNVLQICARQPGESDDHYNTRIDGQVNAMKAAFDDVATQSQNPNNINPQSQGKSWNVLDRYESSKEHFETGMWTSIKTALSSVWQFRSFILDPNAWSEFFYAYIVDEITPTMQILALNILFLVNSIILTITFFRDISIAFGGEQRLFGVSKLI
jgi:hypothetical protein